jgi:5-methylthioribose kinase
MNSKEVFNRALPEATYIDLVCEEKLSELLHLNAWIPPSDKIVLVEKPGEGNMNFVARVKTNSTSIIVKQSRPWVEKYPQIPAPAERIEVEAKFYEAMSRDNFFQQYCPRIIGYDKKNFLLALEDLGEGGDCTFLYRKNSVLEDRELTKVTSFISHVHNSLISNSETFPQNTELKKLNHTHIFYYPYQENNGFDLDAIQSGLQSVSIPYKTNDVLKERLKQLGEVYLSKGNCLIHGDYYPGSWLKTKSGIKIIDPEFSHFGRPEFDMGVMMAHLKMAQINSGTLKKTFDYYQKSNGFDDHLFLSFCGVEIMRRIIGIAQLPLDLTLTEKSVLLQRAFQLILNPNKQGIF